MTWRRATVALVLACCAMLAWSYLRDVQTSAQPSSGRAQAQSDASYALAVIAHSNPCTRVCAANVLEQTGARTWRVRLTVGSWQRCFNLSLVSFDASAQHGLTGLRSASCELSR